MDSPERSPESSTGETSGHRSSFLTVAPVPEVMARELPDYWRTHRHPRCVFPGRGRGWRDGPGSQARLGRAEEPMGVSSIQNCLRLAGPAAQLPKGTSTHGLRHSDATRLLEDGVSVRLIASYLGHAFLETTMIHLHLTAPDETQARSGSID